jgi:hypothetical protein
MPAWRAREAGVKRGRRPHPTRPGSAPDSPPAMGDRGGVARVRAGSAVDRAARRRGAPRTWASSRGGGCLAASACPPTPPPDGGSDGRGGGHQRAEHRRGGHQTAGRRIPDDEPRRLDTGRAGQPGLGRRHRMGGHRMLDADRRPRPWLASWHGRARRRCLTAGWPLDASLGRRVWAINQPGQLSGKDYEGDHAPRTGLDHRHDRQLLGRFAGQAAATATLVGLPPRYLPKLVTSRSDTPTWRG